MINDLTPVIDLLRHKGTGPVRAMRPDYVDLMPPCNNACPAGENIQAWLELAQAGKYREAWEMIVRDNPFPAVHGRVCYHPCETSCNRGQLDSAVSIHAVERFLGDLAAAKGWALPAPAAPSGKRILIVGGGPGGLSAAYHLARLGHAVELRDAGPLPGGMMHYGIPAYRLPRADLLQEIRGIEAMGVRITSNHKVVDVLAEQAEGGFDAVFIAIGAQIGRRIDIPARDAARVFTAISLLHDASAGTPPALGRRVVIYGAGNTAMDAARTARRLGAEEAMVVYRKDRAHMGAHGFEADEAVAEGIKIKWLSSIHDVGAGTINIERMMLDVEGRAVPTGEFETLPADSVVLALGQQADTGFLRNLPDVAFAADGTVLVDAAMMTGRPGIFAGGDTVPGDRSVTAAVGAGKKAARHMDAWLRGTTMAVQARQPVIDFVDLHLPIYAVAPLATQQELPVAQRAGFVETTAGLTEAQARHEARRCLSCGNCYECDQCFAACPEQAIVKLGLGSGYG
ncbi:NAD(P)-binding protein [Paeniroseomonas aquatica]|uniref:NAD(P)-binding protein n=1 Tax=Paeniroseomonas aquatica TaxID=373043 RepID=UPI003623106E